MVRQEKCGENQFFLFDRKKEKTLRRAAEKGAEWIRALLYKGLLLFREKKEPTGEYQVSICAIFKNEAAYLREWIEFHLIIGIDHFYLYNNNSTDHYLSVLKPYIEKGLVTLEEWPYEQKQMECYIDCIDHYADQTKWLGFIDIDEFIVPKSTNTIYEFLGQFENRGSVRLYWKLYGSSGKMERSLQNLVTEDFTVCWPKYCDIGKCFYNTVFAFKKHPKHIKGLHHSLWTNYKGVEIPPVNIFDHICLGDRNIANEENFPIQINHYFTKSYQEYAMKKTKGDVYFIINPHDEEYFFEHEMKCTAVDYSAYKYLIKLKLAMMNNEPPKAFSSGETGEAKE